MPRHATPRAGRRRRRQRVQLCRRRRRGGALQRQVGHVTGRARASRRASPAAAARGAARSGARFGDSRLKGPRRIRGGTWWRPRAFDPVQPCSDRPHFRCLTAPVRALKRTQPRPRPGAFAPSLSAHAPLWTHTHLFGTAWRPARAQRLCNAAAAAARTAPLAWLRRAKSGAARKGRQVIARASALQLQHFAFMACFVFLSFKHSWMVVGAASGLHAGGGSGWEARDWKCSASGAHAARRQIADRLQMAPG